MADCGPHRQKAQAPPFLLQSQSNQEGSMNPDSPIVFVVDDDFRVRESLCSLISSMGLQVAVFGSAAEFLECEKPDAPACLILDLQLRERTASNFSSNWPSEKHRQLFSSPVTGISLLRCAP